MEMDGTNYELLKCWMKLFRWFSNTVGYSWSFGKVILWSSKDVRQLIIWQLIFLLRRNEGLRTDRFEDLLYKLARTPAVSRFARILNKNPEIAKSFFSLCRFSCHSHGVYFTHAKFHQNRSRVSGVMGWDIHTNVLYYFSFSRYFHVFTLVYTFLRFSTFSAFQNS